MRELLSGVPRLNKSQKSPVSAKFTRAAATGDATMSRSQSKQVLAEKAAARSAEKRRLLGLQDAKMQHELKRDIRQRMKDAERKLRAAQERRLKSIEDEQAGFVAQTDAFLQRKKDEDELRKKDMHNLWNENVYQRIQQQIAKKCGSIDSAALREELHQLQENYIQTVNMKTVFRDIIIESEYDPFLSKKRVMKIDAEPRSKTRWDGIVDPLQEQIDKVMEIHEGREHLLQKGGRTVLPLEQWDKVEATPHGFAARIFDESQQPKDPAADQRGRVLRNKSYGDGHVLPTLDHYDYVRDKGECARAEAPRGKKTFPQWQSQSDKAQGMDPNAPPFALTEPV